MKVVSSQSSDEVKRKERLPARVSATRQLTAGAEALLFKFGGTLNLHLGPVTLQVSANYQLGLAAKASGSATIGPHGLPTSVGGRVSAALGRLGASGGITLGSTKAMTSRQ